MKKWFSKNKIITLIAIFLFSSSSVFGMPHLAQTAIRIAQSAAMTEFVAEAAGYLGLAESAAALIERCATIRSEGGNMVRITPESVALSRVASDGKNVTLKIEYSPHGYKSHSIILDDSRDLTGVTTRSASVGVTYAPGKKPAKDDRKKVAATGSAQATSLPQNLVAAFYETKKSSAQLVALSQPVALKSTSKPIQKSLEEILKELKDENSIPENPRVKRRDRGLGSIELIEAARARRAVRAESEKWLFRKFNKKGIEECSKLSTSGWIKELRDIWPYFKDDFKRYTIEAHGCDAEGYNFRDFCFHNFRCYQFPEFLKLLETTYGDSFDDFIYDIRSEDGLRKKMRRFENIGGHQNKKYYRFVFGSHHDKWAFEEWMKVKNQQTIEKRAKKSTEVAVLAAKKAKKEQAASTKSTAGTGGAQPPSEDPEKKPEDEEKEKLDQELRDLITGKKASGNLSNWSRLTKEALRKLGVRGTSEKIRVIKVTLQDALQETFECFKAQVDPKTIFEDPNKRGVFHGFNEFGKRLTIRATSGTGDKGPTINLPEEFWVQKIKFLPAVLAAAATGEASAAAPAAGAAKATKKSGRYDEKESKKVGGVRVSAAAADDVAASVAHIEPSITSLGSSARNIFKETKRETKRETKGGARGKPAAASATVTPATAASAEDAAAGVAPIGVVNRKFRGAMCGGDGEVEPPYGSRPQKVQNWATPEQMRRSLARVEEDDAGMAAPKRVLATSTRHKEDDDDLGAGLPDTYVPSSDTLKEELYAIARKILKKPRHTWRTWDKQFMHQHQDVVRNLTGQLRPEFVDLSDASASDGKRSDRGSHYCDSRSDVQPVDESEDDGGDYDSGFMAEAARLKAKGYYNCTAKERHFLNVNNSLITKMESAKKQQQAARQSQIERTISGILDIDRWNRTPEQKRFLEFHKDLAREVGYQKSVQEENARREAEEREFRAWAINDDLKRIHRTPPNKCSAFENSEYKRLMSPYKQKIFDYELLIDLKRGLKRSPEKRYKDEIELIENHPDKVRKIQEEEQEELERQEKEAARIAEEERKEVERQKKEAARKIRRWERLGQAYAESTDNKSFAASLVFLGKYFDQQISEDERHQSFFEARREAILQTLTQPGVPHGYTYKLENIPSDYQDTINGFANFSGSPAQERVHDELTDAINKNNIHYRDQYENPFEINKNYHIENMAAFVYTFADIARQYNNARKIEQAFAVSSFCLDLITLENIYVAYLAKHEDRFTASVLSGFQTINPFAEKIDQTVEFGKKLSGFVKKHDTGGVLNSIGRASTELSRALGLTSDDTTGFRKKILADGPALVAAIDAREDGAEEKLITFVTRRFLNGSALGLKSSDRKRNMLKLLLAKIKTEKIILAQAESTKKNREMLSPITTIFKQAVEKALKNIHEEDKKARAKKSSMSKGTKRSRAGETKKATPAEILAEADDATDLAPVDEAEDGAQESKDSKREAPKKVLAKKALTKKVSAQKASLKKDAPKKDTKKIDPKMLETIAGRLKERLKKKPRALLSGTGSGPAGSGVAGATITEEMSSKKAAEFKLPVIAADNNIAQLQSISQTTYEENELLNVFDGSQMCGHFAAFNGSRMLDIASGRDAKQAQHDMLSDEAFNRWLIERREIIETYEHDEVGNVFGNHIQRLLEASGNTFYTENTSVLEIANVRASFVQRHGEEPLFLPVDNALVEQIHYFREAKIPQLVILNTGGHWISMVFGPDWMWVADSLNNRHVYQPAINQIRDLFTTYPIPTLENIERLRDQYRNVVRGAAGQREEKPPKPVLSGKMVLRPRLKR